MKTHRATVSLNLHPAFTIRTTDPMLHWVKVAAEWDTFSETGKNALRPVVVDAVRHLFEKLSADYEPGTCWHEDDLYNGGFPELWRLVGGTWNTNALRPYLTVLAAVGLTDDEIVDLLAPIHERNLAGAYGGGYAEPLDDLLN